MWASRVPWRARGPDLKCCRNSKEFRDLTRQVVGQGLRSDEEDLPTQRRTAEGSALLQTGRPLAGCISGASLDQPHAVAFGGGRLRNLKDADGAGAHDVLTSGRAPGLKTLAV